MKYEQQKITESPKELLNKKLKELNIPSLFTDISFIAITADSIEKIPERDVMVLLEIIQEIMKLYMEERKSSIFHILLRECQSFDREATVISTLSLWVPRTGIEEPPRFQLDTTYCFPNLVSFEGRAEWLTEHAYTIVHSLIPRLEIDHRNIVKDKVVDNKVFSLKGQIPFDKAPTDEELRLFIKNAPFTKARTAPALQEAVCQLRKRLFLREFHVHTNYNPDTVQRDVKGLFTILKEMKTDVSSLVTAILTEQNKKIRKKSEIAVVGYGTSLVYREPLELFFQKNTPLH